ncbi:hypothetical protein SKAU_G00137880 [Synaphobranchus kaupii]|uniref:Transposase Helix-turn-helix domain-containing protein n=1 Tax=Synaphobranchus kaupii TaxID=118154 RepID=A0A9Q1FRS0_SYNKA|nr:hypothetical protein SKAU_G00137880 [Synaphobranchus kaupii]
MRFWRFIEPATARIVRITRARAASATNTTNDGHHLLTYLRPTPIDELFLFLNHLAAGLSLRELTLRFDIHCSTVSRIIATWTNFLNVLGAVCLWMTPAAVRTCLPPEFSRYQDTQVVIDCNELYCQTPRAGFTV